MNIAFLSIGSNLGNRQENLTQACDLLEKSNCKILAKSQIYESEPWGFKDQDWFLNQCLKISTNLNPNDLLKTTQSIEKQLKKNKTIENGPRTLDIDILFFNDEKITTQNLTLPHPKIAKRNFVLYPLSEILETPYIQELLEQCEDESEVKIFKN